MAWPHIFHTIHNFHVGTDLHFETSSNFQTYKNTTNPERCAGIVFVKLL